VAPFLAARRLAGRFLLALFFAELFFPALLEVFFVPPLRADAFLDEAFFPAAFFGIALERVDVLAAAFFGTPRFLAAVEVPDLYVLDPPDLPRASPERRCLPPPPSSTLSALTSLLKLLFWPPAVSS